MPFCSRCGSLNPDGSNFCNVCGVPVPQVLPPSPVAWNTPPPPPVVQVIPPYIVVRPPKSVGLAILLTVFFGPLGMFYSTVPGAFVMMFMSFVLFFMTAGLSVFITWPICIIWGAMAADSYNRGLR
jgi:hypothetical protein